MPRHNARGRSKSSGRFVQIHHFLMETRAWRDLNPAERTVYLEVAKLYDGANNGWLALSVRDAADRCNINKDTAGKCFHRLEKLGFLDLVTPGGFTRKVRHAAEWRLTQHRCDKSGAPPSKRFQSWRPEADSGPSV